MKKILILPSWYPNKTKFSGSFFKEQALFLNSNGFDVKILFAEELHTKSFLFQKLKRFFSGQFIPISKTFLIQEPDAFSFPVIIQKNWNEAQKIKVIEKSYLKAYKAFETTIWKPDVIHVQGTYKAGFAAEKIFDKYQIPYVTIEHSPFKIIAYPSYIQNKILSSLATAKRVAGVSHFHKSCLIRDGVSREVEVVWNFMDEQQFHISSAPKNKDRFVVTTITTPAKVKDPKTFFKAISLFKRSFPKNKNLEVYIVGNNAIIDSGLNTSFFEKLASEYDVMDICTFIPLLNRMAIVSLLQKSDVLVSTSTYESFGIAVREAMLCGVPVISTRSGGPEDSINERTGVLVEKEDYETIAASLLHIYTGIITLDSEYIRNYVISQSGRAAFLKSMSKFYTIAND